MLSLLENLATAWISRRAAPDTQAVAADRTRAPAVVVTGGGSGIGLAIANEFARLGRTIVLAGRTEAPLISAARSIVHAHGVRAVPLEIDIAQPDAADVMWRFLALEGLFCDVLVNNAGVGLAGPFTSHAPADIEQLIGTNVGGLTRLTRAVLPDMLARGRGGVLFIASLGGVVPGPWQAAYYASNAYVISLSEAIAAETAGRGVRVSVILPGPTETRFHARMGADDAHYRRLLLASSPQRVARLAIRGYRLGRRVIAPGPVPTLAAYVLRVLPHGLTVPIVAWLLDNRAKR